MIPDKARYGNSFFPDLRIRVPWKEKVLILWNNQIITLTRHEIFLKPVIMLHLQAPGLD